MDREFKVKVNKFSLKNGKIKLAFAWKKENGPVLGVSLYKRNSLDDMHFDFESKFSEKGEESRCVAVLDTNGLNLEVSFYDIVLHLEDGEAILGGLSSKLKLKLIAFPRWTKTKDGHLIYPFVNNAKQFTIQYRNYQKKYDTIWFLLKEYLALFLYFILKPIWDHKKVWLVCEKYSAMAQDNGLYFFKYCMEKLPENEKKKIFYVMDKSSTEYQAVKQYEPNVISFMTLKYMIYLCAAEYLISTDAIRHFYIWDSPNSVFKVLYQARKHIVFLQHGVMGFKQCHKTFNKKSGNRMALFTVSSEYEQKIITDYFGYDKEEVIVTGLPRWDVLHDTSSDEHKEILLMPTWRGWLEDASPELFRKSEYFLNYQKFLKSDALKEILEKNDITLNFYIHPKFREYIGEFASDTMRIRMVPFGSEPLNKLLMSCKLLITDYSSVAWDVYYQEKPVIFFPFDLETYESFQGSYMDLKTEAFGDVAMDMNQLMTSITKYVENGFVEDEAQGKRREYLLPYRDDDNSARIYQKMKEAKLDKKFNLKTYL